MAIPAAARRRLSGFVSRAFGAVSFLVSVAHGGRITFSEYLEELDALGLKGKTFGPECYRSALEAYLDIRIDVTIVDDSEDSDARRAFVEEGRTAVLWYRPERGLAQVFVLFSLSPLEMTASIYHELSHLAAGHLLRANVSAPETPATARLHTKRLAKKAPPVRRRACEMEARIREDYCLLAGALGPECLADDDLRQIR
jgi:hypothetical protein